MVLMNILYELSLDVSEMHGFMILLLCFLTFDGILNRRAGIL